MADDLIKLIAATAVVMAEIVIVISLIMKSDRKRKRMWTRKWLLRRNEQGVSNLLSELREQDPYSFF